MGVLRVVSGLAVALCLLAGGVRAGCVVARVVDGDTVHLRCGAVLHKVRLLGFDTPEVTRPRCAAERRAGQRATAVLRDLVATGPVTMVRFQGRDRYGRDLGALTIAGQDVAAVMLRAGVARPYAGGRRSGWCPMPDR